MVKDKDFYEKQTESSYTKAQIISKYFKPYAKIIDKKGQREIRYLDLFSGPGIYNDGSLSTPLLVADSIASDPVLKTKVRFLFNDLEKGDILKENFNKRFPPGTFSIDPSFGSFEVGAHEKITKYLSRPVNGGFEKNPYPTLLFFDPFGYKGINTELLATFLQHWGNELFLFVNIKRIHAAISNNKFDELMTSLFPTSIESLRENRMYKASVNDRINLILDNLGGEFRQFVKKSLFITPFRFIEEDSKGTSHFIIHFTKNVKGLDLVKLIYSEYDNIGANLERGVYTFDVKESNRTQGLFQEENQNIQALSDLLMKEYKGKTITGDKLYNEHHPKYQWGSRHYLATLRDMESKGLIETTFTDEIPHKFRVFLNNTCKIQFSNGKIFNRMDRGNLESNHGL